MVYEAIESEGGIASLSEMYAWFEREVPSRLYETWRQAVRRSLLDHASESEGYKGVKDLFYSVKGIGSGVWGIRFDWLAKGKDFDFGSLGQMLYEMDEYKISEKAFSYAVSIVSEDKDSQIDLAKTMARKGQLTKDNALDILQSIISKTSQEPDELLKTTKIRTRREGTTQPPSATESIYILKKTVKRMNRREALLVTDSSEWISSEMGVIPVFERDYEDVRFRLRGK